MILSSLQSPQNQRKCALMSVGTLLVFGLVFYTQKFYLAAATENALPHRVYNEGMQPDNIPKDFPGLIAQLWKPTLHPMNDTHFVTDEGYRYDLPEGVHRWSGLGKKLLILDVDTRMEEKDGDLMNTHPMNYKNMTGRTGGWMNHQLYAMIHGYDYRLVRAPTYEGRHGTWVKVPMIKEALKTHDFVVFLDADAVFMYPHMPFEWLMSMWNVTTETLVAMAEDPNAGRNRDHNGWVMWNTGFIIAQQSNRTQELFDVWDKCPTGERYKECGHWDKDWAHEQAAFSNHVRYDYNATDELRVISCMDGNGAPYIGDKKCGGVFIRHHWFHKHLTVRNLKEAVLDLFMRRMHSNFHAEKDEYYLDAHQESYPLDLHV
ncbi:hypothetical protein BGZ61DRAFT_454437 [Ilyonectria robusta]|uniref:uncharacterized protein n=1 Tax=Ilyonectria robusta TaxID=1079257 RepID=UPI001E8EC471|nr:uncharacterized protein BGZ61DRAFT_454437 [Ilyonectria robusta]KAH8686409.1 hypothetical protein BGZ61DRAFT_454437 [Ilyonectria robusta]